MYVSMYFSVDKQNSASGFFGTDLRYTDFVFQVKLMAQKL